MFRDEIEDRNIEILREECKKIHERRSSVWGLVLRERFRSCLSGRYRVRESAARRDIRGDIRIGVIRKKNGVKRQRLRYVALRQIHGTVFIRTETDGEQRLAVFIRFGNRPAAEGLPFRHVNFRRREAALTRSRERSGQAPARRF